MIFWKNQPLTLHLSPCAGRRTAPKCCRLIRAQAHMPPAAGGRLVCAHESICTSGKTPAVGASLLPRVLPPGWGPCLLCLVLPLPRSAGCRWPVTGSRCCSCRRSSVGQGRARAAAAPAPGAHCLGGAQSLPRWCCRASEGCRPGAAPPWCSACWPVRRAPASKPCRAGAATPAAKAPARSGRSTSTLAVLAGPLSVVGGRRAGALLVSWPCRWVVARAGPVALACCSWRLVALLVLARRCSCLNYRNA